jgi:recombination protein RecR
MSKLLDNVVGELSRLPGIGHRTALRLAMHILQAPEYEAGALADAISRFRREVKYCTRCNNISDSDLCPICSDLRRDRSVVCVVEQVKDVISIENTGQYRGVYHVLGGVISPMQGVAPSDLKIDLLIDNVKQGEINEIILALDTTVEGETTAYYIKKKLEPFSDVKISAIARGIGFGDQLDYADQMTITHALMNRRPLK